MSYITSIVKIESVKSYKEHAILAQVIESSNTNLQKVLCTEGSRITAEFEMLSGLFIGRNLLDELDTSHYTDRENACLINP